MCFLDWCRTLCFAAITWPWAIAAVAWNWCGVPTVRRP